ncbi:ABC transporter permease [Cohnella sp. GCM10027633]|uniref:ABC transporter permease n=1 Tax=unclassified Cohnella TaxID=2636738 RepID=UPI0036274B0C
MKSYGALAGRYLQQQRRRSILTIVGIILSVALISALGTMGQALKDNMLANAKYEDGSFHIAYTQATPELAGELKNNVLIDREAIMVTGGSTKLPKETGALLYGVNAAGFDLLPIHLDEGRYPQAANEVIIEQWLLALLPSSPKLGGTVTLNDMQGNPATFTIVGVLKNQKSSQINRSSEMYTGMDDESLLAQWKNNADPEYNLKLYLTFKPGVDISEQLPHFETLNKSFQTNYELLGLLGESSNDNLNSALAVVFGTLIGLVALSTIAVIYNAFHIAVLERIRQFGLLRTLGATPRQIRNLVLREATVLSAIAIPLGLAVGWAGLWLALWLMMRGGMSILQMDSFELTFHWWIMGLSVGVGLFAVYVAAWLPARKASSVSPVEAAKGAGSIVRESYRRMRIPSLLQLLGIEGKMASANIRRNKAKFRITTFSIAVSITLFIVFHYFTQQALNLTVDTSENTKIAFELYPYNGARDANGDRVFPLDQDRFTPEQLERIRSIPGVYAVYGQYSSFGGNVWLDPKLVNQRFLEKTDTVPAETDRDGTKLQSINAELQVYDDARFAEAKKYLESGTADPAKLAADNAVLLIQTAKPFIPSSNKREQLEMTRLKVGDTLTYQISSDKDGNPIERKLKVGGILSQSPFGMPYPETSLIAIGAKSTIDWVYKDAFEPDMAPTTAMYGVQISVKDGADTDAIKEALESESDIEYGAQLVDIVSEQREERQFALQMQIFVYSFLIIIGSIGSLNIINTVQTNLLLRRKEIGLLQSVGMTLGQVRRMASAEGVWFGVIGGFWGIGLGMAISYFLFTQINEAQGIPFVFPWTGAFIASGLAIAVGLLSVQGPLKRMNKASLIDRLREE